MRSLNKKEISHIKSDVTQMLIHNKCKYINVATLKKQKARTIEKPVMFQEYNTVQKLNY